MIDFWLRWVFVAVRRLSLVAASEVYTSLRCVGFSLQWLLLLWSMGSRHMGFSSCSTWAQQLWLAGSRAQVRYLWHTGLVAPRHVGYSQTRDRTRVPCIGRRILNHCATREVPLVLCWVNYFFTFMNTISYNCKSNKMFWPMSTCKFFPSDFEITLKFVIYLLCIYL